MKGFLTEEEIKREICRVMAVMHRRGLISAIGGNVSARIPGAEEFWITPSGIFKGELSIDDLVKVNLEGKIIEGFSKPSVEVNMHREIYRNRPDVNAIVHAHNPVVTGLASAGVEIQPITIEATALLKKVPILPFVFPGTKDLASLVAKHIVNAKALILQNHGVIGVGANLVEAEAIVETLEEAAIAQWVAYHFGKPIFIPESVVKQLQEDDESM